MIAGNKAVITFMTVRLKDIALSISVNFARV